MNYLLKSKPRSENRGKIIWIIALYIFLSLFGFLFGNVWRRFVFATVRPIWSVGSYIASPFTGITAYFKTQASLVSQNESLRAQLKELATKETDYDILLQDNADLKNQLGRQDSASKILSAVLSKPPRAPYDILVIDTGTADGVVVGDKVFAGDSFLIGLVTNVTPHTSLVTLFSTSGQKNDAILSRTGATYTLEGKGGGNFQFDVPKDTDIVWGDTFVFPGLSQSVLASVYYIDSNSQSSFKTLYLRLPENVFAEKFVFVEKNT